MDISKLIVALAPAFAAGFALQRLLEIVDPIVEITPIARAKKAILGLVSFVAGLGIATWPQMRVLTHLVGADGSISPILDYMVTALFVSGGTEGFNSILKFLSYKKEGQKQQANATAIAASNRAAVLKRSTSMDPVFEALMDAIHSWCGIVPDLGDGLSNLWDQAKGGAVPYDPDGIDELVAALLNKPIFANCPLAGNISAFLRGGDRTVDDLFGFLSPCG